MTDSIPLQQHENLRVPAPLDVHLASVTIRSGANNPADGFDIYLGATFGHEVIPLNVGGEEIEVSCEIRKAEVHLSSVNCNLHLLAGEGQEDGWRLVSHETIKKSSLVGIEFGAKLSSEPSFSASAESTLLKSSNKEDSGQRESGSWRIVGPDTVQFGYIDDFKKPLSGRILDQRISIQGQPIDPSEPLGVLARLRVRHGWIDLKAATPVSHSGKVTAYVKSLTNPTAEAEERRRLFLALLERLVVSGLQAEDEKRNATLAADALIYTPADDVVVEIERAQNREALSIDPTAVETFIDSTIEEQRELIENDRVDEPPLLIALRKHYAQLSRPQRYAVHHMITEEPERYVRWMSKSFGIFLRIESDGPELRIMFGSERLGSLTPITDFVEEFREDYADYFPADALMAISGAASYRMVSRCGYPYSYTTWLRDNASDSYYMANSNCTTYGHAFSHIPEIVEQLFNRTVKIRLF